MLFVGRGVGQLVGVGHLSTCWFSWGCYQNERELSDGFNCQLWWLLLSVEVKYNCVGLQKKKKTKKKRKRQESVEQKDTTDSPETRFKHSQHMQTKTMGSRGHKTRQGTQVHRVRTVILHQQVQIICTQPKLPANQPLSAIIVVLWLMNRTSLL